MREIIVKEYQIIPLGKQGENLATRIRFPFVNAWRELYGDGTFQLIHQRKTDTDPYAVILGLDGNSVIWDVHSTDVAIPGIGHCELVYLVDDVIAKSLTFATKTFESLANSEAPEPWESWIEEVLRAGTNAVLAAADAESSKDAARESADEIEELTVSSHALPVGSEPTVTKTGGDGEPYNLDFGIPDASGGGGTSDHRYLSNRDADNQHPISAIEGLETALTGKQSTISDLAAIRAGAALGATSVQTETDPTVPSWAKQPSKPSYTKSEIGLGNVANERQYSVQNPPPYPVTSVNGETGAVTVTTSKIGAATLEELQDVVGDVTAIQGKISAAASSTNKLISASEMGDAIASVEAKQLYATAAQGSFATKAALLIATTFYNADGTVATPTKNDVAYVLADESRGGKSAKYVIAAVSGSSITWGFVIAFSDTVFTQAQMDAINSGATAENIASIADKYEKPTSGIPKSDLVSSVQTSLGLADNAVQKETGKGLSSNDYTTSDKNKLAGIAEGAEANVQPDWTQTNTGADDYIKNKPTVPTQLSQLSGDSTHRTVTDTEKLAWNNKSDFSGNYNDLTNKPTIPDELADLGQDSTHRTVTDAEKSTWNGKIGTNAIVTSVSSASTNSQVPSAKLLYDTVGDIEAALQTIRGTSA